MGAEAGFDRTVRGTVSVNKWSVVGSYDIAKVGPVSVAAKAGTYLIDPSVGATGGGLLTGVGATYPLNKKVSLTADYVYQSGADRVSFANGNYFTFGAKYSF
jgi:predicted porin